MPVSVPAPRAQQAAAPEPDMLVRLVTGLLSVALAAPFVAKQVCVVG
jgi:hypothetical protein